MSKRVGDRRVDALRDPFQTLLLSFFFLCQCVCFFQRRGLFRGGRASARVANVRSNREVMEEIERKLRRTRLFLFNLNDAS
eukprot:jgi/Bigna1/61982/fgenesh1_kg.28_\